jgi:peptidyl-prolyl cis-trans isomerase B (cyclophilin B)
VAAEDHDVIRAVRARAAAFNEAHPSDARGLALELQLSQWLDDGPRVDELFARLATAAGDVKIGLAWARYYERKEETEGLAAIYDQLAQLYPDDPEVAIARADYFRARNEYGRAIEILESVELDAAAHPKGALVLSECLFAEQRYQEAVDVLESIPQETLDGQRSPGVRRAVGPGAADPFRRGGGGRPAAGGDPHRTGPHRGGALRERGAQHRGELHLAGRVGLLRRVHYDGSTFHRVLPNFMSQGGDPNTKPEGTGPAGSGGPGYCIPDEHTLDGARNHFTGSLAMAKTEAPNTGGCQFYITHTAPVYLNGRHTVFGRTVEGLDVARSLELDDVIETVNVLSKRDHEYRPETLPDPTAIPPAEDLDTALGLSLTPTRPTDEPADTPDTPDPGEPEE